jgi:hypothetical protein
MVSEVLLEIDDHFVLVVYSRLIESNDILMLNDCSVSLGNSAPHVMQLVLQLLDFVRQRMVLVSQFLRFVFLVVQSVFETLCFADLCFELSSEVAAMVGFDVPRSLFVIRSELLVVHCSQ